MSIASHSSGPGARSSPLARDATSVAPLVRVITFASGLFMLGAGAWAFVAPGSFAAMTGFAGGGHFVHDVGAFQIGIGATLLLALVWRDALAVALGGYVVGGSLHVAAHVLDVSESPTGAFEPIALAATVVLAAFALALHLKGGIR